MTILHNWANIHSVFSRVSHLRTSQAPPVRLQSQLKRDEHGEQCGAGHHRRRRCYAMLHGRRIVAFEDVHQDARRLSIAGLTSVVTRVTIRRPRHFQPTLPADEVGANVDALINVVVDHTEVVIPEEIRWYFRGLLYQAMELQRTTRPHEFLRRAGYLRSGFCKRPKRET